MLNIILGVTGSVAAIKTQKVLNELSAIGSVNVVATKAGQYFLKQAEFEGSVLTDEAEWTEEYVLGDPILHIELRRNASALVIAPLDVNTLAKIALGLCDNLLTCLVRAWDWNKPMILAPAANTMMYENSPTKEHLQIMRGRGAIIVDPVEKTLACGDVGIGAMAPAEQIAQSLKNVIRWQFPISQCPGIPINHHPGAFGFHRKKNHHTGVDLYCKDGSIVYAVEDGTIVHMAQFTGAALGHTWWNDTWGMMVEGSTGVVNYGEIHNPFVSGFPLFQIGDKVKKAILLLKSNKFYLMID
jgi:phosphopantothenoylcysteine decarboxylase